MKNIYLSNLHQERLRQTPLNPMPTVTLFFMNAGETRSHRVLFLCCLRHIGLQSLSKYLSVCSMCLKYFETNHLSAVFDRFTFFDKL